MVDTGSNLVDRQSELGQQLAVQHNFNGASAASIHVDVGHPINGFQLRNDLFIDDAADLIQAALPPGLKREKLVGELLGIGLHDIRLEGIIQQSSGRGDSVLELQIIEFLTAGCVVVDIYSGLSVAHKGFDLFDVFQPGYSAFHRDHRITFHIGGISILRSGYIDDQLRKLCIREEFDGQLLDGHGTQQAESDDKHENRDRPIYNPSNHELPLLRFHLHTAAQNPVNRGNDHQGQESGGDQTTDDGHGQRGSECCPFPDPQC